ncbi:MAG: GNAT family N-acetyltransferase [Parabacteroides gordonii]|uniref:GNAT family N-acetyltransferase n=1 Tax=Parabacteroides gordonii TaxID=574930 RepID=UPI003A8BA686
MENTSNFCDNYVLRLWDMLDVDSFFMSITPDIIKNLRPDFPRTKEDIRKFIKKTLQKDRVQNFAIVSKDNERQILGGISYIMHESQEIELAYLWIAQRFRDKGIGTLALKELINLVRYKYPNHTVFVQIYDFNKAEEERLPTLNFNKEGSRFVEYEGREVELNKYTLKRSFKLNYNILELEHDTFALRKLNLNDADEYCLAIQDGENLKFLRPSVPITKDDFVTYMNNGHEDQGQYDLVIIKDGDIAGGISIKETDGNSCEFLNFWIKGENKRTQLGTHVIKSLIDTIFKKTQLCKIFVYSLSSNNIIKSFMKKMKFSYNSENNTTDKDRNNQDVKLHYYEKCKPFKF